MKIGTLIRRLETIRSKYGNLDVAGYNWENHNMPTSITGMRVEIVKKHFSNGYFISSALKDSNGFGRNAFYEPWQSQICARPNLKIVHLT